MAVLVFVFGSTPQFNFSENMSIEVCEQKFVVKMSVLFNDTSAITFTTNWKTVKKLAWATI